MSSLRDLHCARIDELEAMRADINKRLRELNKKKSRAGWPPILRMEELEILRAGINRRLRALYKQI